MRYSLAENIYHESLNHDARDALDAHDKYGLWAFLGGGATTVPDGVLSLDTEEEATGEAEDIVNARRPVVLHLNRRQVTLLEVTVREGDQPPDDREAQPGQQEAQNKAQQGPTPLRVHQGREDVLQKAQ